MPERDRIEGILLKVDRQIINVATKAQAGPDVTFRYTHSTTFQQSCQGKAHVFETESVPRGLCHVLRYECKHY